MLIKADKSLRAYYNEIDPFAASWIRELILKGIITPGDVDERSIEDVTPADIVGYDRVHMFAGIAGWDYALNLAGWGKRKVWTGSCPCQPFSTAGKGTGFADERHLWPAFFHLITQCEPATVFGEQVASKDGLAWLDLVQTDMEAAGYAFGAVDLCAAGFGAPHIRQRSFWMADGSSQGLPERVGDGRVQREEVGTRQGKAAECSSDTGRLADAYGWDASTERQQCGGEQRQQPEDGIASDGIKRPDPTNGFWRDVDWLLCRDGKWRPVEARAQQMVDGLPESMGRVRDSCFAQIEKEVMHHAEATKTRPEHIVRELWESLSSQEERERETGRLEGLLPAKVLLSFMCQLASQGWKFSEDLPLLRQKNERNGMRMLRDIQQIAGAPYQRGLDGQQEGEHSDAVRVLSCFLARLAQEAWGAAIQADAEIGFPLGHGSINRVGRLRGYGNAIVPQVAAEVIRAYLDVRAA